MSDLDKNRDLPAELKPSKESEGGVSRDQQNLAETRQGYLDIIEKNGDPDLVAMAREKLKMLEGSQSTPSTPDNKPSVKAEKPVFGENMLKVNSIRTAIEEILNGKGVIDPNELNELLKQNTAEQMKKASDYAKNNQN